MAMNPVCKMQVDENKNAGTSEYPGQDVPGLLRSELQTEVRREYPENISRAEGLTPRCSQPTAAGVADRAHSVGGGSLVGWPRTRAARQHTSSGESPLHRSAPSRRVSSSLQQTDHVCSG